MNALLAFLLSLQSTLGPTCFLNDQGVVTDSCFSILEQTIYVPTVLAVNASPTIEETVMLIVMSNKDIFDLSMTKTLPSAYYLKDDIQYFPQGHEFKLQSEAAALRAARTR